MARKSTGDSMSDITYYSRSVDTQILRSMTTNPVCNGLNSDCSHEILKLLRA